MRIVGGTFRGRNLQGPKSAETRPTSDRVRESIFNILAHGIDGFEISNARVMDLFAGTGALGFEALSRGARFCQFVDESADARATIRSNADTLGVTGLCKVWRRDATDLGDCAPQTPYDLVFCDPPYNKGLGEKALQSLVKGNWVQPKAVIVLEEAADIFVSEVVGLTLLDQRKYGDTQAVFLRVP